MSVHSSPSSFTPGPGAEKGAHASGSNSGSTVVFEHLSYQVPGKAGAGKLLVDDVSVSVKAGELLAIMGPSGAGKSTLLDLMAFRKTPLDGAVITLNGAPLNARKMQQMSTFVEQEDALLGVLTVRESVAYALRLHLPLLTTREVAARVNRVLTALGLQACAHQRIGTPISRGISGGQKRRVTAACAMVTFPRILLLDEVTSGLDSTAAHSVLSAIRTLAQSESMHVIATIHQPSLASLGEFTNMMLIAGGRVCWLGRVGGGGNGGKGDGGKGDGGEGELARWMEEWGWPVGRFTTPSDHAMNFLNNDFTSTTTTADGRTPPDARAFRAHWLATSAAASSNANSNLSAPYAATHNAGHPYSNSANENVYGGGGADYPYAYGAHRKSASLDRSSLHHGSALHHHGSALHHGAHGEIPGEEMLEYGRAGPWGTLFWNTVVLAERTGVNYGRNLLAYGVRGGMYAGMGFMLATIWIHLGTNDSTINDRLSVHFFSVAFLAFMSVAGIPGFLEERAVYYRETNNGLYSTLPFVLANTLINMPFLFVCTLLFGLISYWAIGLHPGGAAFFRFLGFLYLAILAAESQMVVIAALMPIFVAALAIGAFVNGFWMSVGGYFIKARSLPRFWYYSFHYMDYQRYAFELLVNSDLRGLTFKCVTTLNDTCACAYPSSTPETCTVSGADVLAYLDVGDISYGSWAVILIAITLIYRIALYAALKLHSK